MAKSDALMVIDALIERGSHANLNTKPGVRILEELREVRELVDQIEEGNGGEG